METLPGRYFILVVNLLEYNCWGKGKADTFYEVTFNETRGGADVAANRLLVSLSLICVSDSNNTLTNSAR